jgi:hypothetical protein
MNTHSYRDDLRFLQEYTEVIELANGDDARVAITPGYQARVMTSTLGGDGGPSFGWINRAFVAAHQEDSKFNNYGGEDRFWLGPEAGQFGLWFRPGDKFTLDDFKTPAGFNTGAFQVVERSPRAVTTARRFAVSNYSGTRFDCAVRRAIRLLDTDNAALGLAAPIPAGLRWVGFESVNGLTNAGRAPWQPRTGLLCVWILGMFNPLPHGHAVVPCTPGNEAALGPKVNPYFGEIPDDRLQIGEDYALFRCDGACRTKIGVPPLRARSALGAWDPDAQALTIVTFNLPAAPHRLPYVNSQWEIQKDPYGGDVVNSYNDGRDPITGTLLGPFFELETSSPAVDLAPGETLIHVHRTYHFSGPLAALDTLSRRVLGLSLATVTSGGLASAPVNQ